jgi:hypothetical protein
MWNLSHMMLNGTDSGCFLIHKVGEAVEKKSMATKREELHSDFYETYPLIQLHHYIRHSTLNK